MSQQSLPEWYSQGSTQAPQQLLPQQGLPQSSLPQTQVPVAFEDGFTRGFEEGMKLSHQPTQSLPQGSSQPLPQGSSQPASQPTPQVSQTPSVSSQPQPSDSNTWTITNEGMNPPNDQSVAKPLDTKASSTSDSNPLGIPAPTTHAAQPPSSVEKQTSTTSNPTDTSKPKDASVSDSNPLGIPAATTHAAQPAATDKAVPVGTSGAPTDVHPPAPVVGSGAENPQSTPSSSSTVPAHPEKVHKGLKTKFKEWKQKRKSGSSGADIGGDVHPHTIDGKTLPSQDELSKYMHPGGNDSADTPALAKDPNDATGKTITGSDANPSKASNPFHAPTPALHQAPVDAKAQ